MFVTAGAKTKNWRGVVFTRTSIKSRDGKLISSWVCGFCTEYEAKEIVKEFVKERGGTWDGAERFWFVPLQGQNMGETLEDFWYVAREGIESFSKYMDMGGIHISVEANIPQSQKEKVLQWLKKKVKVYQSGLSIVPHVPQGVATMPTVRDIKAQEIEDEDGNVRLVKYSGIAEGSPEYLYKEPQNSSLFDEKTGIDAEGNTWYWLPGERIIDESFT